jgi:2-methylaconitate cis-trans-isomerase PrpF
VEVEPSDDLADPAPKSVAIIRTARLLMSGTAYYIPGA